MNTRSPIGRTSVARRWTANALTMLAVAGVMVLLLWPAKFQPLPAVGQIRLTSATQQWSLKCTQAVMAVMGFEMTSRGSTVTILDPDRYVHQLTIADSARTVGAVFWPVVLAAVLGAIAAAATWNLGAVRRSVLVVSAVLVPPVLLIVLDGAFLAVALATWIHGRQGGILAYALATQTAAFVTLALTGLWWWALWELMSEKEEQGGDSKSEADAPPTLLPAVRPPALWAAPVAAGMAIFLAVPALMLHVGEDQRIWLPAVRLLLQSAPPLACLVLTVLALLGRRGAAAAAPLPLLLMPLLGGGGLVGGAAFLIVLLAVKDLRTRALFAPPDEETAARIARRVRRPLTWIAWVLLSAAAMALAALVIRKWLLTSLPVPRWIATGWALVPLAVAGGALAMWEAWALARDGLVRPALPARAGVVVAALLVAAAVAAGVVPGRERVVPIPVPWPEGVRVDDRHRLLSFPGKLGPFVLIADGELRRDGQGRPLRDGIPDGEMIFREELLAELGILTGHSDLRLAARTGNWYLSRVYRDTRPGADARTWQINVTWYTGAIRTFPQAADSPYAADPHPRQDGVVAFTSAAEGPWNEVRLRRLYHQFEGPLGRSVECTLHIVDGKPEASASRVRSAALAPERPFRYYATVRLSGSWPAGETPLSEMDRQMEEFFRHALPAIRQVLPSAEEMDRLNRQASGAK